MYSPAACRRANSSGVSPAPRQRAPPDPGRPRRRRAGISHGARPAPRPAPRLGAARALRARIVARGNRGRIEGQEERPRAGNRVEQTRRAAPGARAASRPPPIGLLVGGAGELDEDRAVGDVETRRPASFTPAPPRRRHREVDGHAGHDDRVPGPRRPRVAREQDGDQERARRRRRGAAATDSPGARNGRGQSGRRRRRTMTATTRRTKKRRSTEMTYFRRSL